MKTTLSLLICFMLSVQALAQPSDKTGVTCTGTWAAAAEYTGKGDMPRTTNLANTSVRQIVKVSLGGNKLVLQLSNEFGSAPVEVKSVYIADASDSCNINIKTSKYLTFNKKRKTVIPVGGVIDSDVLEYPLKPLQLLSITVCYGDRVPEHSTSHRGSRTTSYIARGEVKPKSTFKAFEKLEHWYNICKINVLSTATAVAVLGNSITDGRGSTTNKQNRWPDMMSEALNAKCPTGVLNLGIGGNCVVKGGLSEPALKRFDRDILGQSNVDRLIIFQGTNDIGTSHGQYEKVVEGMIRAYEELIAKAKKKGMKVYGGTITPFKGNGWYSYFHEAMRRTVNQWIRTSGKFDGIIDFDELTRDPLDKEKLRDEYSEDGLHLNPAGYRAMGEYAAEILSR
ncbi:SGNH/GDSL hydrolase family protein [Hallella bergensis]|uniref:SGNH/GDSL hydrolase family protein n=1 Tax=Hallella bergensis TaxID=242750 RepID=UPI003990AB8D